MQFFEIIPHHAAGLHLERAAHHVRGDEGIAIAVAANPASHLQERRKLLFRPIHLVEPILQRAMQARHFVQESVIIK